MNPARAMFLRASCRARRFRRARVALLACLLCSPVAAQVFPADADWINVRAPSCSAPLFDAALDTSGSAGARDLVRVDEPSAAMFADATHLYFRLRVDSDPRAGDDWENFAWGCQLSTDGDPSAFEFMLMLRGGTPDVAVFANTVVDVPETADDVAETFVAAVAATATSNCGVSSGASARDCSDGSGDFFIDLAAPLSALDIAPGDVLHATCGANANSTPRLTTGASGDIAGIGASGGQAWSELASCAFTAGCQTLGCEAGATCGADGICRSGVPCANGFDDDNDGLIDFPADPGCASDQGASEAPEPACADGTDNDGDGTTDHPDDRDCYATTDAPEAPACSDGLDNDADGNADMADPDCGGASDPTEADVPRCSDLLDDDGDGWIDFPADPGCSSAVDEDETDPGFGSTAERPRVLLAVATSGSLNGDRCTGAFTGGDGTTECPGDDVACSQCGASTCGNGLADDSRIAVLRASLSRLVASNGGVEFGLMRSYQRAAEFTCPAAGISAGSGAWQGGGPGCLGGFDAGALLIAQGPDTWRDFELWLDASAGVPAPVPPYDFELRGTGPRPLAGLLRDAGSYLAQVRAGDAAAACRPYHLVLIADGGDQCGADPAPVAAASFDADIPVHVVGLAAASTGELDSIAAAGGTGQAIFVDGTSELTTALSLLVESAIPRETCNGLDDDCDGTADEDFPQLGSACDNGLIGACARQGSWICGEERAVCSAASAAPVAEACNGVDDDCDGRTDEDGVCAVAELCNGIDDDGDTLVDENYPLGASCTAGLGACSLEGQFACAADQRSVDCRPTGATIAPARHDLQCDGIDEDCDGRIDEEATGELVFTASGKYVDRYEASRPDATLQSEGTLEHRACSTPGVLPWRNVTQAEAQAACNAAGKRLCTAEESQAACAGVANNTYPYGNVYAPNACNGEDHDPDCQDADQDSVLATGMTSGCPVLPDSTCVAATGVVDASGNLREWTATSVDMAMFDTRGGGYLDEAPTLACSSGIAADASARRADIGFRCCADSVPGLPPVLEVAVEGSGTVVSSPPGIFCADDCQEDFPAGATVTLTATARPGARFVAWSGDCTGSMECSMQLLADAAVSASFETLPVGNLIFADGFEQD